MIRINARISALNTLFYICPEGSAVIRYKLKIIGQIIEGEKVSLFSDNMNVFIKIHNSWQRTNTTNKLI